MVGLEGTVNSLINPHLRVTPTLFFSCLWSGVAISLCFVCLRFGIRLKVFRQLFWDDAFVAFAMVALVALAITWSTTATGLFLAYDIATGRVVPTPDRIALMLQDVKIQLAGLILFFSAIWAIKIAFLLFFRRIGERVQGYKIWYWWVVTGIVIATYIVSIGFLPYRCMTTSNAEYIIGHCISAGAVHYYYTVFYINMGFDVITDLLLISIPVLFLWNVRIPLKQKLGLIGLFSLTLAIIAVAIVRLCVNGEQNGTHQDAAWVALWAAVELTIALIVASLGSFRQLFTKSGSRSTPSNNSSRPTAMTSIQNRLSNASALWQRGHTKSPSHMALMREETAYSHHSDERVVEIKGPEVEVTRTELPRSDVPLKRASQAHIAHYSAAPTERRYMVVHPGDQNDAEKSHSGFI